jgi:hypothetical protein
MSYVASMKLSLVSAAFVLFSAVGLPACSSADAPAGADVGTSEAALGEAGTLTFGADFRTAISGTLQKGKSVRVAYDASRLTACRGDQNGHPAWTITGYWKIGNGPVRSFEAGGFSPSGGSEPPVLALDASGDLQLWFQNNSVWGCNAYDSDFGKNYHFAVQPAANEPGWMGNVRDIVSRQTCGNAPCESDMHDVTGEVLYDTWARQRAAIRSMYFEVWKEGVTDFDNANLWKQLDVQVHSRVAGTSAFHDAYVAFDRRAGNNARYAIDLGALDPIPGLTTLTKKSDCPAFSLSAPADNGGQYVEAVVELYFTVNGAELRPAAGDTFKVRYQNYKGPYAVCLP